MFAFHDRSGPVETGFTDRHGGVSTGPFASLNLATPPGAPQEAPRVARNTALLAEALGGPGGPGGPPRVVVMRQVHGARVVTVTGEPGRVGHADAAHPADVAHPADGSGLPEPPEADALVTARQGLALLARAADCVPVLLADPGAGVVGAAHAGRRGVVLDVVGAAIEAMAALGATDVRAWVGPRVCGGCYEVPAALRQEVADRVPATPATTRWGTPALDLGAGVLAGLAARGVPALDVGGCTMEEERFFSYRRQGVASGRQGGVVLLR